MYLSALPKLNYIFHADDLIGISEIGLIMDERRLFPIRSWKGILTKAYLDQIKVLTPSVVHFLAKYEVSIYDLRAITPSYFKIVPQALSEEKYGFRFVDVPIPSTTEVEAIFDRIVNAVDEDLFKNGFPLFEEFLAHLIFKK